MHFSQLSAIALIASCASAYENSSPFYLYSTADFEISPIKDLSLASSVQSAVSKSLSQCPTTNYIIISQSGISADDFTNAELSLLGDYYASEPSYVESLIAPTSIKVRDVIGTVDVSAIEKSLTSICNIHDIHNLDASTEIVPDLGGMVQSHTIVNIDFPALDETLTTEEVRAVLHRHSFYLSMVITNYFDSKDYTVIYTSSSREAARLNAQFARDEEYVMNGDLPVHQDLKRGLGANFAKSNGSSSNQTIVDGPLFDKYQFLTPGIFMGGIVFLLLLSILYVGFSALMSLQVTYGAFDKEQGQLAGKKAQ